MTKKTEKYTREEVRDVNEEIVDEKEQETEDEKPSKKKKKKTKLTKDEELKELTYQYADLNDKYLRLFSEFDNYRKRTNKEKIELINTASEGVIESVLPVLDDFDRALKAFKDHNVDEETVHGVELIYNKFYNTLKQKGLEPMDSLGKTFDTDYHDAITQTPAESDEMKGKVFDVIEKGYLLKGKIIRHAKVVVSV